MATSSRRFDTADIIGGSDMLGLIDQSDFLEESTNLPDLVSSYCIEITTEDRRSRLFDLLDQMVYLRFSRAMIEIGTEMTVDELIDLIGYTACTHEEAMSLSSIFIDSIEKHPISECNLDSSYTSKP